MDGVPVVDAYKYLGVWLDQKLTPQKHLRYLFGEKSDEERGTKGTMGKINFLISTLGRCFPNISFDYRANLWVTFIRPLFLPLATLATIMTKSEKEMVQIKLRVSLRKFLGLPKNFRKDVLFQVFPIDFCEWMEVESEKNRLKWEARQLRAELETVKKYEIPIKRCLPAAFGKLLRSFTAMCKTCKKAFYPEHLEEHGLVGIRIEEMFGRMDFMKQSLEESANLSSIKQKGKVRRATLLTEYTKYIESIQEKVDRILMNYAENFREMS